MTLRICKTCQEDPPTDGCAGCQVKAMRQVWLDLVTDAADRQRRTDDLAVELHDVGEIARYYRKSLEHILGADEQSGAADLRRYARDCLDTVDRCADRKEDLPWVD